MNMMKTHFKLVHGKTICGRDIPIPTAYGYKRGPLTTFNVGKVTCLRCLFFLNRKTDRLSDIQLVHLHVSTLRGSSFGAIHWYSELQTEDEEGSLKIIELSHPLTPQEAVQLNQSDGFHLVDYKAGDSYSGFWSHESAASAGLEQWRDVCPEGLFLVLGRSIYLKPKIVVDTVFKDDLIIKTTACEIVAQCEDISWFDYPANDKLMDQYSLQWLVLLQDFAKKNERKIPC